MRGEIPYDPHIIFIIKENNMSNYVISCCSTADLTREHMLERNIKYACFHYELDGKEYMDDLGQSMPLPDFYKAMEAGAMTKTSQINQEEYMEYFRQFLDEGYDVLHCTLSSGISGTVNSARLAKEALKEEYPDRKIYVIVSNEGKLIVREKIRTKKKAIKEMLVKMQALCKDGADYSDKVYISNSACYEDAKAVADLIEAAFPKMKGKVEINDIGTTIGSHTGPGTVALFFWGNKRED